MDPIYAGLCFAQFFTFCAYAVVSAGAALLQAKANSLDFDSLANSLGMTKPAFTAAYNSIFTSTTYIIGYGDKPQYQFQYEWWIIEYEFFIFAITAALTLFPRFIPRGRIVALTFMASALVLVMDNINAIWFLLRNETACAVYGKYRIETAQAGLLMVGVGNALTIIFMGLYQHPEREADVTVTMSTADAPKVATAV